MSNIKSAGKLVLLTGVVAFGLSGCSSSGTSSGGGGGESFAGFYSYSGSTVDLAIVEGSDGSMSMTVGGNNYVFEDDELISTDQKGQLVDVGLSSDDNDNVGVMAFIEGENLGTLDARFDRTGVAVAGNPTASSAMPTTTAEYSGSLSGFDFNALEDGYGEGTFTATANFGAENTHVNLDGEFVIPGNGDDMDETVTVTMRNGAINANRFSGDTSISGNSVSGTIETQGGFFGDNARYIAGGGSGTLRSDGEDVNAGIGFLGEKQ